MRSYVKRPLTPLAVAFDFSAFVASVDGEDVSYELRAESGLGLEMSEAVDGVVTVTVTGGIVGRQYLLGVEASTEDGRATVQMARIRLREPAHWPDLEPELPTDTLFLDGEALFFNGLPLIFTPTPTP